MQDITPKMPLSMSLTAKCNNTAVSCDSDLASRAAQGKRRFRFTKGACTQCFVYSWTAPKNAWSFTVQRLHKRMLSIAADLTFPKRFHTARSLWATSLAMQEQSRENDLVFWRRRKGHTSVLLRL